jgi:acetyl-CoA C-acetyltransferase
MLPDVYLSMGQTAENVATTRGVSRARQDEWGVLAEPGRGGHREGFFAARSLPVTMPDGTVHRPTTGRGRA